MQRCIAGSFKNLEDQSKVKPSFLKEVSSLHSPELEGVRSSGDSRVRNSGREQETGTEPNPQMLLTRWAILNQASSSTEE